MKTECYHLGERVITVPIPESYKDCITLIKSDRYRTTGKKEKGIMVVLYHLMPFTHSVLFWFRMCQHRGWLWPLCRVMHIRACRRSKVYLPLSVKAGYGLYMGHCMCMVVAEGTVIGNNVNLSQFVNIGTNNETPAVIGDNVYIGPHASLVEDVHIGNCATIGAGAVVTRDVPENATVVGVPARVLHYNEPGRFIKSKVLPSEK